jgi:hypothetical protein
MSDKYLGLIGVLVGFALAVGFQEMKGWLQRIAMRRSLLAELRSNLYMLPQKCDIISQIRENLSAERLLPGDSVRFSTVIYQTHYPTLSWRYSDRERNSLHVIYEQLRTVDSTLAGYADQIVHSLHSEGLKNIIGIQLTKMKDMADVLNVTEKLISDHLAGNPDDVLHLAEDYKEIKDAQFRKAQPYVDRDID